MHIIICIYIYYIYIVIEVRHDSQCFIFFRGICDAVESCELGASTNMELAWHQLSNSGAHILGSLHLLLKSVHASLDTWHRHSSSTEADVFSLGRTEDMQRYAGTSRFSWVILHTACFNFPDSEFLLSFKQLPRKCSSGPCASWPSSSATCPHLDKELVGRNWS